MKQNILYAITTAQEVAEEYNPNTLVPFPFTKILDRCNDLEMVYGSTTENGISGAILYDEATQKYKILINSDESEARRNFSIAHELGHYFLHKHNLKKRGKNGFISVMYGADSALLRDNSTIESQDEETEANAFAAELLMPEYKMRQIFSEAKGLTIEDYARVFHVSTAAMAIRVERLGLADGG